jgi:uncharacterized membrane protein YgaE (UPF0421/DUF939 family)
MNREQIILESQLALRAALAAALSVAIAQFCKLQYPIYALIAAVIVTDLSSAKTRKLGLLRVASTVVGAMCAVVAQPILHSSTWGIGLGILIAMLICQLSPLRDGARAAGYICGIVLLAHSADVWAYALFRLLETVLGIGIAWLISLVPRLIRIAEPMTPGGNKF